MCGSRNLTFAQLYPPLDLALLLGPDRCAILAVVVLTLRHARRLSIDELLLVATPRASTRNNQHPFHASNSGSCDPVKAKLTPTTHQIQVQTKCPRTYNVRTSAGRPLQVPAYRPLPRPLPLYRRALCALYCGTRTRHPTYMSGHCPAPHASVPHTNRRQACAPQATWKTTRATCATGMYREKWYSVRAQWYSVRAPWMHDNGRKDDHIQKDDHIPQSSRSNFHILTWSSTTSTRVTVHCIGSMLASTSSSMFCR